MTNLNNRLFDQVVRYIMRSLRFEICVVDRVRWHKSPWPGCKDFNVCDVVIRDRALEDDDPKDYVRYRCTSLNGLVGRFFGSPWTPRRGDVVKVWFYQKRKGIILGTEPSFGNEPVCRPDPYTIREKICQYRPHTQTETLDFPDKKYPYPEGKKPTCQNWHHGPCNGDKTDDEREPLLGRDWWQVYDFCQQGDEDPTCQHCLDIDYPARCKNTWRKVYSRNTMSCDAPDGRLEDHVACGSYSRWESESGYSKEYSEGKGHIRIGNAVCEADKRFHLNVQGVDVNGADAVGTFDLHTNHEEVALAAESEGVRFAATRPEDDQVTWAYEFMNFPTTSYIRCYKDGKIVIDSCDGASVITVDGTTNKVTIAGTANVEIDATDEIELNAGAKITLNAPLTHVTQDHQIDGTCTHGPCSCP